jgi:HEAT repeat protein
VQGILANPDSSAKASALLLVARSKDPALEDAVGSALSATEWSVRAAAAHVVATHPFPALRQKLLPLLDDRKGAVRLRAAAAYIRLQQPTSLPVVFPTRPSNKEPQAWPPGGGHLRVRPLHRQGIPERGSGCR